MPKKLRWKKNNNNYECKIFRRDEISKCQTSIVQTMTRRKKWLEMKRKEQHLWAWNRQRRWNFKMLNFPNANYDKQEEITRITSKLRGTRMFDGDGGTRLSAMCATSRGRRYKFCLARKVGCSLFLLKQSYIWSNDSK